MIVVDTSAIVAFMNAGDRHHAAVRTWLEREGDALATTPMIVAETDHLVASRGSQAAAAALRADLAAGAYSVEWWPAAMSATVRVAERYTHMALGLADASLVVLADRLGTLDVATLDERHFRALRPLTAGSAFRLLPFDA